MFTGKTLLITGGTGTFGNAMLRRFLNTNINEIRVFSRDEKKQDEMRNALRNPKVKFYLGNVRDYDSILAAMTRRRSGFSCRSTQAGTVMRIFSIGG